AALKDGDLELVRRAQLLIQRIENGMGPEQPVAAARLLTLRQAPGAIEGLFDYLPYADNPYVGEEVLNSLGQLTIRPGKIDPALSKALKDPLAERRAAGIYILGRRGEADSRDMVRQYLDDANALVRERAAASLVGKSLFLGIKDSAGTDAGLLKSHKIDADE